MNDTGATGLQALHARRTTDPVQPWRPNPDWNVGQRVDHPDAEAANRLALLDLEGGADCLTVVAAASPWSRGYGLADAATLATTLDGVALDLISMRLDAGAEVPTWTEALSAIVAERRLDGAGLDIDLGFDPVALAARGHAQEAGASARLVAAAAEIGLGGCPLIADARPWHEAGATPARELALVLATSVEHLRILEAGGLPLGAARRAIAVLLPFDAELLPGLAKARAMRRLWACLEAACGLRPAPLRLHGETSWRMMTLYDPWTNAMRATIAVLAAGLGGADVVTALPMTLSLGLPDESARRLARNTGRVLLDEARLGHIDDPAAGSGALETLTDELCETAWALFQAIEGSGGLLEALRDGTLPKTLALDAAERSSAIATLSRGIIGTSRFPSLEAPACEVLDVPRRNEPEDDALSSKRDAEPFERLRSAVEARALGERRPSVFLAPLGTPDSFGARVVAATGLLAAAGIEAVLPPADERDLSLLDSAFEKSGTIAACLCGDGPIYAEVGAVTASALRHAGARVVLALDGEVDGAVTLPSSGERTLSVLATLCETLLGQPRER